MDAINKFAGIQRSILSESQELQIPSEHAPQQVFNAGVGRTTDGFENLQQLPFEFGKGLNQTQKSAMPLKYHLFLLQL